MLRRFRPASNGRLAWSLAGAAWILAVVGGLAALAWYESVPAVAHRVPAEWPGGSALGPSRRGTTLVLFAHPRCPCTRATLGELEKLMAHAGSDLSASVLFFKPEGAEEGWEQTDLWRSAAAIPGVRVLCDEGGVEAVRFGASASGHALFYDAAGKLLFSGGITFSRGHEGDNAGRDAIELLSRGERPGYCESPVFGCAIVSAAEKK
jgi:hypothetical protein